MNSDDSCSYKLHRCRFLIKDGTLDSVIAVKAIWPLKKSSEIHWWDAYDSLVAVARNCGDIEVWGIDSNSSWNCIVTLPSLGDNTIKAVVWVHRENAFPRLLSTGLNGQVVEWDLCTRLPSRREDCYGGAVWAAEISHDNATLALGCEDGTIRMFDISDTMLRYTEKIQVGSSRILSLAWSNSDEQIAIGSGDGLITIMQVSSFSVLKQIAVEKSKSDDETLIWALGFLTDGSLVHGDSLGHVQLWDRESGTLMHSFSRHTGDVLGLTVHVGADIVVSAGIDGKVVEMQKIDGEKWVVVSENKAYAYDIMALCPVVTSGQFKVLSGSLGGHVRTHLIGRKGKSESDQTLARSPLEVSCTRLVEPNLLLANMKDHLQLWSLGDQKGIKEKYLMNVQTRAKDRMRCAQISKNGLFICYSTTSSCKLFSVSCSASVASLEKVLLSFTLPVCNLIQFSLDSKWLCVLTVDLRLIVVDLETLEIKVEHSIEKKEALTCFEISNCKRWIAMRFAGNMVKVLDTEENSVQSLPRVSSPITCMKFHQKDPVLVIGTISNLFYLVEVPSQSFSEWTREFLDDFPDYILNHPSKWTGITFDPNRPSSMLIQTPNSFCYVDLELSMPSEKHRSKKRKFGIFSSQNSKRVSISKESTEVKNFKWVKGTFNAVAFADFVGSDEFVVVEIPFPDNVKDIPDPLFRNIYGF